MQKYGGASQNCQKRLVLQLKASITVKMMSYNFVHNLAKEEV